MLELDVDASRGERQVNALDKSKGVFFSQIAQGNARQNEIGLFEFFLGDSRQHLLGGLGDNVDLSSNTGHRETGLNIARQDGIDFAGQQTRFGAAGSQALGEGPGAGAQFENVTAIIGRNRRNHLVDEEPLGRQKSARLMVFDKPRHEKTPVTGQPMMHAGALAQGWASWIQPLVCGLVKPRHSRRKRALHIEHFLSAVCLHIFLVSVLLV